MRNTQKLSIFFSEMSWLWWAQASDCFDYTLGDPKLTCLFTLDSGQWTKHRQLQTELTNLGLQLNLLADRIKSWFDVVSTNPRSM